MLSAILLSTFAPKANSATDNDVKNLLSKYCYPANNSNCSDEELADYDSKTNSCKCKLSNRVWDKNKRVCMLAFDKTYSTPGTYTVSLAKGKYEITVAGAGGGNGSSTGNCRETQSCFCVFYCWCGDWEKEISGASGGTGGRGALKTEIFELEEGTYTVTIGKAGTSAGKHSNYRVLDTGYREISGCGSSGTNGETSSFSNLLSAQGGGGGSPGKCNKEGWHGFASYCSSCLPRDGSNGTSYGNGATAGQNGWVKIKAI